MKFTEQDKQEIKAHGLTLAQVEGQIDLFKKGVPNVELIAPATIGNGILKLSKEEESYYLQTYEEHVPKLKILKFTPASGAASRMFKHIHQFLENYDPKQESIDDYLKSNQDKAMHRFFEHWRNFPFYDQVWEKVNKLDREDLKPGSDAGKIAFLEMMMEEEGLNFGNQPKGLLPFHNYGKNTVTAFEEHLHEAAAYASTGDQAELHFTVSPEHEDAFESHFKNLHAEVREDTGVTFKISFSSQKPYTDTVAVTLDNELYRKNNGALLFRPGGHGALIENLNEVDADLIFIKNIDNVLTQEKIDLLSRNKKVLAGILLQTQEKIFNYCQKLDEGTIENNDLAEIEDFAVKALNIRFDDHYEKSILQDRKERLKKALHRPLRVCGMVENVGEPGGGPFWIAQQSGGAALQIIEGAQVQEDNEGQKKIFKSSTHFNPVDIVCGVRDHNGKKYDLTNFVNSDLAFIAHKSIEGNEIKALELPGLWNGAMAHWNSIFVEVPIDTFNPVKTVNDLLKPAHQT